ncbi:MAG: hypothetical protein U0264_14170 [Candidatus Kapaibacterium sp.]
MKNTIFSVLLTVILLCIVYNPLKSQPIAYYPNCGNVNCTTATNWTYVGAGPAYSGYPLFNVVISYTTVGTPPFQIQVPCTTTVYVEFRWRICDGKYEVEIGKFWWDYNQCPINPSSPTYIADMKALHLRVYQDLMSDFFRSYLKSMPGGNGIVCPPNCCPEGYKYATMSAASCYYLAIEWDDGIASGGNHHIIPTSASQPIANYLINVPANATPYISVNNCQVTTCCTRNYKICYDINTQEEVITEDVQPPPVGPQTCPESQTPPFTCYPRCD